MKEENGLLRGQVPSLRAELDQNYKMKMELGWGELEEEEEEEEEEDAGLASFENENRG